MSVHPILSKITNFNLNDHEDQQIYNFCKEEKGLSDIEALALALDYKISLVARRVHAGMPVEETGATFNHQLMKKHKSDSPHLLEQNTKAP